MILIAIGANLPSRAGSPRATCAAALDALQAEGVRIEARSRWYESAPEPPFTVTAESSRFQDSCQ